MMVFGIAIMFVSFLLVEARFFFVWLLMPPQFQETSDCWKSLRGERKGLEMAL